MSGTLAIFKVFFEKKLLSFNQRHTKRSPLDLWILKSLYESINHHSYIRTTLLCSYMHLVLYKFFLMAPGPRVWLVSVNFFSVTFLTWFLESSFGRIKIGRVAGRVSMIC